MAFSNLSLAKEAKKDEFYTQFIDIENELKNYTDKFKDKIVYCNCDDPFNSNFVKYFLMNFNKLGLKELIATGFALDKKEKSSYVLKIKNTHKYIHKNKQDLDEYELKELLNNEVTTIKTGNTALDDERKQIQISIKEKYIDEKTNKEKTRIIKKDLFYEAGDFRSNVSISLLKEADIVVTNPPFSLFREYVMQLIKYNKKFLIIGNQNAITYKEIFPLIKENKMWLGYGFPGNVGFFESPYEDNASSNQHKKGKIRISGVMWFTNMDHEKRHKMLPLDLKFSYKGHENYYPKYDNYNAINVDKTSEIPYDYKGIMGVPITFLDYFCPEQFQIVGLSSKDNKGSVERFHDNEYYNGYTRGKVVTRMESNMPILNVSNKGGTVCKKEGYPDLYQLYWRIFIKFNDE